MKTIRKSYSNPEIKVYELRVLPILAGTNNSEGSNPNPNGNNSDESKKSFFSFGFDRDIED